MKRFRSPQGGGTSPGEEEEARRRLGAEKESNVIDPRDNPAWAKRVTQAVGKSTDRRILKQLKSDFVAHAKRILVG